MPSDRPPHWTEGNYPLCPTCFEYNEPWTNSKWRKVKNCVECQRTVLTKRQAARVARNHRTKKDSAAERRYMKKRTRRRAKERKAAKRELTPAEVDAQLARQKMTREERVKMEAKRELARRELARRSLLEFIRYFEPTYDDGWVHKEICTELEQFAADIVAGRSPHLIICMPPRHGKSMIASEFFPAWFLGRYPELEVIASSYAGSLANQFSRRVQDLIRDARYKAIFPEVSLAKNHESIEEWSTAISGKKTRRGGYRAAGVGGPITGKGADCFIIDDPVKNREEAESAVDRLAKKNWFTSTAYTRLMPGGGMLLILTRWHDDDLAGWQLAQYRETLAELAKTGKLPEGAIEWKEIKYAAIATEDEEFRKKGEPLHPSRFPLRRLMQIKRTLGPRDWSALYQQEPTAEEGAFFKKEFVRYYRESPPPDIDIYIAADLSISKKESADWTVFVVVGLDAKDNVYIMEEVRARMDANEIVSTMFRLYRDHKPRAFGVEHGAIWEAIKPHFYARVRAERLFDIQVEDLQHKGRDKELRARPIQGRMALGQVLFPENALWVPDFINEMLRFPNGVNDDRVDAVAWIGQMLAAKSYIGDTRRDRQKSWKQRLKDYVYGDGRSKDAPSYMTA